MIPEKAKVNLNEIGMIIEDIFKKELRERLKKNKIKPAVRFIETDGSIITMDAKKDCFFVYLVQDVSLYSAIQIDINKFNPHGVLLLENARNEFNSALDYLYVVYNKIMKIYGEK